MSNFFENIGIDQGIMILILIVLVLILMLMTLNLSLGLHRLKRKYMIFMKGKDAGSLEEDITGLYEDNDFIKKESDKNRKEIKDIQKRLEYCYQKMGMVKYDAFSQMGGQLSFCLCLLNEKDDGFILNSVQSSDGCYTYTKEVKKGECAITLGAEEKEALDKAIGY